MTLSSHATRWLVTLIAAPILFWVILAAPSYAFYILVTFAGLAAWWEYFILAYSQSFSPLLVLAVLGWVLAVLGAGFAGLPGLIGALVLAMFMGVLYFLFQFRKLPYVLDEMGRFALGHLYVSLGLALLVCVYYLNAGRYWVLFCLLVTFLGDTCAYYAGKTFGRHRLYPAVSPKKTWEGLLGNMLGCAAAASIYSAFLLPAVWYEAGGLGLFLGLWGTVGDLFESAIKRESGIKDSGKILLGHGGILDRVDALLFNIPVIFLFALFRCP